MSALPDSLAQARYKLTPRPQPVPGSMRRARRVTLLLLIIDQCRGSVASLEQLHVLNWAVRNDDSREALLDFLGGESAPDSAVVRYDPVLSRILAQAEATALITRQEPTDEGATETRALHVRYGLTDRAREQLKALRSVPECLKTERAFLRSIGRKLTRAHLKPLFRWGE